MHLIVMLLLIMFALDVLIVGVFVECAHTDAYFRSLQYPNR